MQGIINLCDAYEMGFYTANQSANMIISEATEREGRLNCDDLMRLMALTAKQNYEVGLAMFRYLMGFED